MQNLPLMTIPLHINPTSTQYPLTVPKPISYEFRVVEYTELDKVTKVKLQYKIIYHDEYGAMTYEDKWKEVPRIKIALDEAQT
jgi:hypothetical protein